MALHESNGSQIITSQATKRSTSHKGRRARRLAEATRTGNYLKGAPATEPTVKVCRDTDFITRTLGH